MGIVKNAFGLVGRALFGKPKAPAAVQPLPQITPRRPSAAAEAIAGRRGSAANNRTGGMGAESSATSKNRLLGRN